MILADDETGVEAGNQLYNEMDTSLRLMLGEQAIYVESASGNLERETSRVWTSLQFSEQRELRKKNRPNEIFHNASTAEDVLGKLQTSGIEQTSYDLHPESEELPLHHPMILLCEYATSDGTKSLPPSEIARTSQLLLSQLEERVNPPKKFNMATLLSAFTSSSQKATMAAELAEAKMLGNIVSKILPTDKA